MAAASGLVAFCAFMFGRYIGREETYRELERDVHLRREVLENLARIEGMRLVGRE